MNHLSKEMIASFERDAELKAARPQPIDRDPSRRPGVPMISIRQIPVHESGDIPRQEPTVPIFVGVEVGQLTPVFGTANPPRGLSGAIRRRAYDIPEHQAGRWMLLILGDRVDVWESRMRRNPVMAASVALGALGLVWGVARLRSR